MAMRFPFEESSLDATNPGRQLRGRYILALSVVAGLTLISQLYVQSVIKTQRDDASVIDVAGRQRMLSQQLAKSAVLLRQKYNAEDIQAIRQNLANSLEIWQRSHLRLRYGTSTLPPASATSRVAHAFAELQPSFDAIQRSVEAVLATPSPQEIHAAVETIVQSEQIYLPLMNAIVGMLGGEASDRVASLKRLESTLCVLTLTALVLAAMFVLEPAARRIGRQFVELQAAQRRLALEFEALNRSTARAEITVDGAIAEVNDRFVECAGCQREHLVGQPFESLLVGTDHQNEYWQDVRKGQHFHAELTWKTGDGVTRHVQTSLNPVTDEAGNVVRVVLYARDVTERHDMEKEKQELNFRLHEAARKAGMAEVATGVLHNVGNVLTSVTVSSNLLMRHIREIPLRQLERATEIIVDNHDNLAEFMTNDDRGKKLPIYLDKINSSIKSRQETLLNEAVLLTDHVDHMRSIVAMQQSVARHGSALETIDVQSLIEDAIRLNQFHLSQHDVEVVRRSDQPIKVVTFRHEVLQVLVNLVRNAQQATVGIDRRPKIVICTEQNNESISVSINDNGIGIPEGNLDRLFEYGFTTKDSGSGFGLHASANTAKSLGGSLSVASDGADCGATFTLRLPVHHPEMQQAEASH